MVQVLAASLAEDFSPRLYRGVDAFYPVLVGFFEHPWVFERLVDSELCPNDVLSQTCIL